MTETHEQLPTRPPTVLEDPSARAVAATYADALLRAAGDGAEETLETFRSFLDDVVRPNARFESLITSPYVPRDDKVQLIDRVLGSKAPDLFVNFLKVLARNERLESGMLDLIVGEARRQRDEQLGRRPVTVTTARPLADDQKQQIADRLRAQLSFDPVIETAVDETLLGGMVVRVGDTVYDSSLRSRLKQMRGRLHERALHEISSRRDRFAD